MSEKFVNTRPMRNIRRVTGWLVGLGCAMVWISSTFCLGIASSLFQLIPEEYRQAILHPQIPLWGWIILIFLIVTGFVMGNDIVRWLYKE